MGERRLMLVRHGQTEFNATGRMQGQLDTDLSPTGVEQAKAAAECLKGRPISAVYSSDLMRAVETAKILAEAWGVPVVTDPRLRETDLGQWQGASHGEVDKDFPEQRFYWKHDPTWAPPLGETRLDVAARAYQVVEEIMDSHDFTEGDVVIVAHGGTIGALTARLLELPVEHYPIFSGLGNVCWSQLVARPRFVEGIGQSAAAVDGSTVPRMPEVGEMWWRDARWHLESWNVGVNATGPMGSASPDEGGEDGPA